jgi:hypothetical protein
MTKTTRRDKIERELEIAGLPISEATIGAVALEMELDTTLSYEQAVKRHAAKSLESMIQPSNGLNPHDLTSIWNAEDTEEIKVNRVRDLSISLSQLPIEVAELILCASQANQIRPEIIAAQLLTDALTGVGDLTASIKIQALKQKQYTHYLEHQRIIKLKQEKEREARLLEIEALRISESMSNGMRPA